ncbi:MAG: PEGA domain-containing protein [Patescibacteria group bacterium]|jgi:hypothetical protein
MMSLKQRRLVLILFLAIFAVTAPTVILATKGYRYNWKKARLEKTGVLRVNSQPEGAAIRLNGELYAEPTPASVFRLLPQEYEVSLEKAGYFTWKKKLEVWSGSTTFAEKVILIRNSYPRLLEERPLSRIVFDSRQKLSAEISETAGWTELSVTDRSKDRRTTLARFDAGRFAAIDLNWSPDSERILFTGLADDGRTEIMVYPADGSEPLLLAETKNRLVAAHGARWSADGKRVILAAASGIFSANAADGTISPLYGDANFADAIESDGALYLLRTDPAAAVLLDAGTGTGDAPESIVTLQSGKYRFLEASGRWLVIKDLDRGKLHLIDLKNKSAFGPFTADRIRWEKPDGGRLLLWNDFEISVFDPGTGQREVVTRLSTRINDCLWHPGGQNIIYATAAGLKTIEVDGRDQRNVHDLSPLADCDNLTIDNAGKLLWYLGNAGNRRGLYEQDL